MKKSIVLMVLVSVAVVFAGCSGATIKKEAMSELKYVGLLSVTLDRDVVPSNPGNDAILQEAANYAFKAAELNLSSITSFRYVPVAKYYGNPVYKSAGDPEKLPGAAAYLKQQAENDPKFAMGGGITSTTDLAQALGGMLAGAMAGGEEQKQKAVTNFLDMGRKTLNAGRQKQFGTTGLPFIPYGIFNDTDPGVKEVKVQMGNAVEEDKNYMKEMMLAGVADLCKRLKLDGVIVIYAQSVFPKMGSVRLITGDRMAGDIKLNTTMLLINKKGEIVADLGWRTFDDLAPNKSFMPVNLITEREGKLVKKTVIDLKDAKGSCRNGMLELVAETSASMVKEFRKEIGEIK